MFKVQQRNVLWCLTFAGFAVNYMIYNNLNITIVEMIKNKQLLESDNHQNTQKLDRISLEKVFLNWTQFPYDPAGFDWSEYEQNLALGSYFWLHWITQIPGGILAMKYGTKKVFGYSNVLACWICLFMPIASYCSYKALIVLRLLQGFVTGLAWPAMHHMCAKWIPPDERAQFVTSYLGSSIGVAVFHPIFGYMMDQLAWEYVFHFCAVIGTIWWFAWQYFVYDSPAVHPRIELSERLYIEQSLGDSVQKTNAVSTPWRQIFCSRPFWMNVIAQWGGIWGLFTLMAQAPTYFRSMHNWSIRAIGWLSGLPHVLRIIFAYGFSVFADHMLHTGRMERTDIRKLATTVANTFQGMAILALAMFGYNGLAAACFFTLSVMLQGAVSSGPLAALVDIAPNHAGILLGISSTIDLLPGFISPYLVSCLTFENQSFEAWKYVFLICAAMGIGTGVLYFIYADASVQHWNNTHKSEANHTSELKPLQHNNVVIQNDEENVQD